MWTILLEKRHNYNPRQRAKGAKGARDDRQTNVGFRTPYAQANPDPSRMQNLPHNRGDIWPARAAGLPQHPSPPSDPCSWRGQWKQRGEFLCYKFFSKQKKEVKSNTKYRCELLERFVCLCLGVIAARCRCTNSFLIKLHRILKQLGYTNTSMWRTKQGARWPT